MRPPTDPVPSAEVLRDYNGEGAWSLAAVRRRYAELAADGAAQLTPREHVQGRVRWIYPVMDDVIARAREGDAAAIELCVRFVLSGHQQAFGRILHATAARTLRRVARSPNGLSRDQRERLRARILDMLVAGQVPHEYHEYARLLGRIGFAELWPDVRARVDTTNRWVMRWVGYFEIRHVQAASAAKQR